MSHIVLILLLFFTLKHFVCDFIYQPPWMYLNKGNMLSWGAIAHSGLHALVSLVGVAFILPASPMIYAAILLEFVIHWSMDAFKVSYNKKKGWGPTTHNQYWILLGFDQLVHNLTYIIMILLLVR